MTTDAPSPSPRIPFWINILQGLLILIMLSQVYLFYFDHPSVIASGITIDTVADHNLAYEFAARTLTMALVSAAVVYWQRIDAFLAIAFMNLLREGQETIVDPLFPLANAPVSPTWDVIMHLVILGFELAAFVQLFRLSVRSGANVES